MKRSNTNLESLFVKQLGAYSCGLACISMISKWYGGDVSQEKLRTQSGTTLNGTSLLGLSQAARMIGFDAKAYEGNLEGLKTGGFPVILHVQKEHQLHYVVFFGYEDEKFIIGDPAWGMLHLSEIELDSLWKSRCLLDLHPTDAFVPLRARAQSQWLWFQSLIRQDIPILVVSAVLGLLIAGTGLSTAIFSQKLIDDFLPQKNIKFILIGLILLGLLLMIRAFLGYLQGIFMAKQARDLNLRLVSSFIERMIGMPLSFFKGISTGDLIARMNDSLRIRNAVSLIAGGMVVNILVILVSLGYLSYYAWEIGLIGLSGTLVYFLVARKYHNPLLLAQREMMDAHSLNESQYIESFTGIATVKSYGKEEVFSDRINGIFSLFQNSGFKLALLGNSFGFGTQVVSALYITVIFSYGVWLVVGGNLQIGEMMALVTVGGGLIPAVAGVVMVNIQLQEARVAFDRLYEVSSLEAEVPGEATHSNEGLLDDHLRIEKVAFRYPGKVRLLKNISFEVKAGESVAVFGKIGSGKSTLLDIVQGFYTPEEGRILLGNCAIESLGLNAWKEQIAVVAQHEKVFNSTVIDNIVLSNDPNEVEKVIRFLADSGLQGLLDGLPQGLLTLCGEDGRNLSGGQRQLLCLARALYKKPRFLFLDESTSAMDFDMEGRIVALLKTHCRQNRMGMVLVTHRLGLARQADRIAILEEGCITTQGTHPALVAGDNLYAKAYRQLIHLHETV
jgi:ABC-type bacteriocin/lantibiotic exporter with double-glycine peptidase domain